MVQLLAWLELLAGVGGLVKPLVRFAQWLFNRQGAGYEMSIVRFNEYLYRHFGSYFFTVCTTESRYLDVKTRNDRIGLQRVFETLSRDRGPRLILLSAEGGMGKTALAAHIVRQVYLREKWFNLLLGGSAKQQAYVDGEIKTYEDAVLTYASLLDVIGKQFGIANIHSAISAEEKLAFLQRKLRNQRALILIDNLETLTNTQEIVDSITRLVANTRGSRVLITTRDGRVAGKDLLSIHLDPLTPEESLDFAKWYIQIRGLDRNSAILLTANVVKKAVSLTGGSPLAIEQLFSQLAIIGTAAIDNMQQARGDWKSFFDFLFSNTLRSHTVTIEAKRVLRYIATLHRPSTYDDLRGIAAREGFESELDVAIKSLVGLDLVKLGRLLSDSKPVSTTVSAATDITLYSVSPILTSYILRHMEIGS